MERGEIEARITKLKAELASVEGGSTEVYSRIVGYYRSVRNWNAGKREEYGARLTYAMPGAGACSRGSRASDAFSPREALTEAAGQPGLFPSGGYDGGSQAAGGRARGLPGEGLFVFTRAACPNCPPLADYVAGSGIAATFVDVDLDEGLDLAREHGVLSTPTVLSLDAEGRELFRAQSLGQLKAGLAAVGA